MGQPVRRGGGLLYTLSLFVFITSILISGGVFGYQKYLEGKIKSMDGVLVEAREALQPELIKVLTKTNDRFIAAEQIISKHEIVSGFFNLLENLTLQSVSYSSLAYSTNEAGVIEITMKGFARSYAAVALQAQVFSESKFVQDSIFSDLDLNDVGDVTFSLKAHVDPSAVSYETLIKQLYGSTAAPTTTPATAVQTATSTSIATSTSATPKAPAAISNTP
mgnify:CR=1 FL=1